MDITGKKKFFDSGCITSGDPQRSVLGPLLFIIDISGLDMVVHSIVGKFPDDKDR